MKRLSGNPVRIGLPLQPFNAWPLHESFRHRLVEPFTFGFVNPRGPFFLFIVLVLL
jgi:hypothetical protein